jgi:hypothetical protein
VAAIHAGRSADVELLQATYDALGLWLDWLEWRAFYEPFRGECPACGQDVVVVRMDGEDVVLEVLEVLPAMRCPRCAGNVAQGRLGSDPRSKPCWRCGDTRVVGQDAPSVGVAVGEAGRARLFTGEWRRGDAVHLLHSCCS